MNKQVLAEARRITAEYLKQRRIDLGIEPEHLAKITGLSITEIEKIESGKEFISTKELWILCNALSLYFFLDPKESGSEASTMMKWRFMQGKPPSEN